MSIHVISAIYGIAGNSADVTELIKLQVLGGNHNLAITNHSLGGDPAVGHVKQLTVEYRGSDGELRRVVGTEGGTLQLHEETNGHSLLPRNPF